MEIAQFMDINKDENVNKYLSDIIFKDFHISKYTDERMPEKAPEEIAHKIILGRKKQMLQKEIDKMRLKLKTDTDNREILENYWNLINKKKLIDESIFESG